MFTPGQKKKNPAAQLTSRFLQDNITNPGWLKRNFNQQDQNFNQSLPFAKHGLSHNFSQIPVFTNGQEKIQAKFKINTPGDNYEQEADRIADHVTRTPKQDEQKGHENEGLQTKAIDPNSLSQNEVPAAIHAVLNSSGQPLEPGVRRLMESHFHRDFRAVKVHSDTKACESALQMNALAYTSGTNIVFAPGRYDHSTETGRKLLAHELTHVVQQTDGGSAHAGVIQRQPASPLTIPSTDLRENASPLLAGALGSTVIDRFSLGSAKIPKEGEGALREASRQILYFLNKYPLSTVQVVGHADSVGTEEKNMGLGEQRANEVKAFLQMEGISPDIIRTESKGESEPAVPAKNEVPQPVNRRVQVFFRVEKRSFSLGGDYSLKPPTLEKAPPPTLLKPRIDLDPDKPRIPYRDPKETETWKRMEENQRKIDEFDRTHPRENKSIGEKVIDLAMDKLVKPVLKELPISDSLRKKAEGAIRDGLQSGSEKVCEMAIDKLDIDGSGKDALKAACKAALKQKPGSESKP